MAKQALSVLVLLAACAALAAAHPGLGKGGSANVTIDTGFADTAKEVVKSMHSDVDLSNCQCKDDCKEETRKVCKVTEVPKEKCETVKGEEDILECATKCFKADKVVTINVPGFSHGKGRRLLEVDVPEHGKLGFDFNKTGDGVHGGSAGGSGSGGQTEICREICKPGKKPTKKKECDEVMEKKYDCKEEVVSRKCVKKCKCGDKVTVEVKQVPDYSGALPAALIGAAALKHPKLAAAALIAAAHSGGATVNATGA